MRPPQQEKKKQRSANTVMFFWLMFGKNLKKWGNKDFSEFSVAICTNAIIFGVQAGHIKCSTKDILSHWNWQKVYSMKLLWNTSPCILPVCKKSQKKFEKKKKQLMVTLSRRKFYHTDLTLPNSWVLPSNICKKLCLDRPGATIFISANVWKTSIANKVSAFTDAGQ